MVSLLFSGPPAGMYDPSHAYGGHQDPYFGAHQGGMGTFVRQPVRMDTTSSRARLLTWSIHVPASISSVSSTPLDLFLSSNSSSSSILLHPAIVTYFAHAEDRSHAFDPFRRHEVTRRSRRLHWLDAVGQRSSSWASHGRPKRVCGVQKLDLQSLERE